MNKIELTQGKFAIVDNDDFERLNKMKWFYHIRDGYAVRNGWSKDGNGRALEYMHRVIMDNPEGFEVDHIDGNRLNNSKRNLRISTKSQNQMNRKNTHHSSKYKGVSKFRNKWEVNLKIHQKKIFLGHYDDEDFAAKVYDEASQRIFGEYSLTNFESDNEKEVELIVTKRLANKDVSVKSKQKGVTWDKNNGKWRARKTIDGKMKFLGNFIRENDAINIIRAGDVGINKPVIAKMSAPPGKKG